MAILAFIYLMYAQTRTDILAHLGGLIWRRKFDDRRAFLFFVCDKEFRGFPYGELIACAICNSPWQGILFSLIVGEGVVFGIGLAGIWVITDTILRRIERDD